MTKDVKTQTAAEARRQVLRRLSLRLHPDTVLRQSCRPVEKFDSTLRDLLDEMRALMRANNGIGLAGPQVGLLQQLFIGEIEGRALTIINPALRPTRETKAMVEGCLSLPGIRVNVRRPARVAVTGFDARGKRLELAADGLWSRVIQHEADHLRGVLILDHGPPVREAEDSENRVTPSEKSAL